MANRYNFCQADEEPINRLLLHCEKTRAMWEMFFTLFGVSRVFPSLVKETLLGWNGFIVGKKCKIVWRADPLCIFEQFGRQEIKLPLKMMCCPSKG